MDDVRYPLIKNMSFENNNSYETYSSLRKLKNIV